MALDERYNFEDLVNEAEHHVLDELERQLRERGLEDPSEESLLDMAAYALNHVAPLYRVNLLGRLYARNVAPEYREQVSRAVSEAIEKIKAES